MATLSEQIQALINISNDTTKATDVKLGDAIKRLADGYSGSSGEAVLPTGYTNPDSLSSQMQALIDYANGVTGSTEDDTLSKVVATLVEGYNIKPSYVGEAFKDINDYHLSSPSFMNDGDTIVWEQIISMFPTVRTFNGLVISRYDDYSISITGTATQTSFISWNGVYIIPIGKYLIGCAKEDDTNVTLYEDSSPRLYNNVSSYVIVTNSTDSRRIVPYCKVYLANPIANCLIIPCIYNITAMFGDGNEPSTADEFAKAFGYDNIYDLPYFNPDTYNGTYVAWKGKLYKYIDNN